MGIQISLIMRDDLESSTVKVNGFDLLSMTDAIAQQFGIVTAEQGAHWPLWDVARTKYGRYPDWFHACDGAGKVGWKEFERRKLDGVRAQKKAVAARILGVQTTPAAQVSRRRKNDSAKHEAVYTVTLSDEVSAENSRTTSNEWSVGNESKVGVEIGGELSQVKTTVETTVSFGYVRGEERTRGSSTTKAVEDSLEVTLGPGEEALCSLSASRGIVNVEVDYDITLMGEAMFSFVQRPLRGKRDHLMSINQILYGLSYANRGGPMAAFKAWEKRHGGWKDFEQKYKPPKIRVRERFGLGFVSDGVATLADAKKPAPKAKPAPDTTDAMAALLKAGFTAEQVAAIRAILGA